VPRTPARRPPFTLQRRLGEVRADRARIDAAAAQVAQLESSAPTAVAQLLLKAPDTDPPALPAA
jgi:type II secretory pathway component PulM